MKHWCRGTAGAVSLAALVSAGEVAAQANNGVFVNNLAQQPAGMAIFVPTVDVVGVSPVMGTGINRDLYPGTATTLDRRDVQNFTPTTGADLLDKRLGSVNRSDTQNNPFQPNIDIRGFTASPILGEPIGIAVYQNGVRVNEPFGDVVQWDLIPTFAINRMQVLNGTNPVFGLNALGGAVSVELNNGFNFKGIELEGMGGSFGRKQGTFQYGVQVGNFGFYTGVRGTLENGWRQASPSHLTQSYTDLAFRRDSFELGVGLTYARTSLTGNGVAPVELLDADWSGYFTAPDITRNRMTQIALRGRGDVTDWLGIQGNAYFRDARRRTFNGDFAEAGACTGINGTDPADLCFEPGEPEEEEAEDINGDDIPATVGGNGVINRTRTRSVSYGGSLQATVDHTILGMKNAFLFGGSIDFGHVKFANDTEIGALNADRVVPGAGILLGGDEFNTGLDAFNRYYGLFLSNTLSLTSKLHVTFAGRFNYATLRNTDLLGSSLTGVHDFRRFNPGGGIVYQFSRALNVYASYNEANRIPTSAELACSDPLRPCRFPNAFVSDPPLKQVVSRGIEIGARGRLGFESARGGWNWNVAGFRTVNADDIIFVSAGPTVGSGFFQNAGRTQRIGLEAGVDGTYDRFSWYASYGFTRATFRTPIVIQSPDNPSADANGDIFVQKGDRMPGVPLHSLKLGMGYAFTDRWSAGLETIVTSSKFLRGDESNSQDPVDGYAFVNLKTSYRITDYLRAFARVENVLNTKYETFGLYGDPTEVFSSYSNPRFFGPGQPRAVWVGLTLRLGEGG